MSVTQNKILEVKGLYSFLLLIFIFNFQNSFAQFTIPDKPSFQTSVYDYAKVLNDQEAKQLEEKLVRYSDSTSTQIVFISIDDLKGEDIGILTPKWAHQWGIGQEKTDNGILILLSKNNRKIWIAPGYGVEDRLTAGINGEIIRNIIIPEFKAGSYYQGLDKGTDAIIQVLKGKYKGERKEESSGKVLPRVLIILFIITFIVLSSRNRGNGGNSGGFGGPDLGDFIILSSLGRGGFGGGFGGSGGSSGGGGFGGGFGGGGFSGGGAGGDW